MRGILVSQTALQHSREAHIGPNVVETQTRYPSRCLPWSCQACPCQASHCWLRTSATKLVCALPATMLVFLDGAARRPQHCGCGASRPDPWPTRIRQAVTTPGSRCPPLRRARNQEVYRVVAQEPVLQSLSSDVPQQVLGYVGARRGRAGLGRVG